LRGILERLPKTLDETYERVLKGINEDNRGHARRLLHSLAVAIRPLRVEELAEILTFDFDNAQGGIPTFHASWRWKDKEEAVLSTCSSLITIVDSFVDSFDMFHDACRVVQFSHFSVKEFLMSDRLSSSTGDVSQYHILPGPAHTILVQACLGFLLHLGDCEDKETVKSTPLAKYAAEHWVAHAQFEDVALRVKDGIMSLFDSKRHLVTWLEIYDRDRQSFWSPLTDTPNPLYYAALCGFHDLVEYLAIIHPQLVNATGGNFGSPLLAALSEGHFRVAECLLRHVGVDVQGTNGHTPLHMTLAIEYRWEGTADAVLFLLKHGADINSRRDDLCTPLHMAASHRDLKVAQVLLEHGAEVDSLNDKGQTPLHVCLERKLDLTTYEDVLDITRLLLEHGANVNAQDKDNATPLLLAIQQEMYEVVGLLLKHGAEPNTRNNDHATLLLLAIQQDLYEIAGLLLEHGAEPNVRNNDGENLLHLLLLGDFSFELDILKPARLLLEYGADVNAQDKGHTTPLLLAMERGLYEIAELLLEHGAEHNVKNGDGRGPLHLLSFRRLSF
jgi:ankyrin repeat protein